MSEEKKGFIAEFKEFISRGNVLDMAVGIVIGSAFTAIITSLVDDVIGPVIGMICSGIDFSALSITVGSAQLMIGSFIQAIINFLLVSLVVFLVVKAANKVKKAPAEEEAPAEPSDEVKALREIVDLLKDQNSK